MSKVKVLEGDIKGTSKQKSKSFLQCKRKKKDSFTQKFIFKMELPTFRAPTFCLYLAHNEVLIKEEEKKPPMAACPPPKGLGSNLYLYKTELCHHHTKSGCKLGSNCHFAHGDKELLPPGFLFTQNIVSSQCSHCGEITSALPAHLLVCQTPTNIDAMRERFILSSRLTFF